MRTLSYSNDTSEPRRACSAAARRAELSIAAALLSAGAAAIHAAVAGPHFQEYVLFGALFIASALAQAVWAVLVLVSPSRRLLVAGAAGNAGIVVVWAISRTVGPPLGPEPWSAEPITALDLTATMFELGVVVLSGLLLIRSEPQTALSGQEVRRFAAVGAAAIVALTGAAFAGIENGAAGHHHAPSEHAGAAAHDDHRSASSTSPRKAQAQKAAAPRSKRRTSGSAKPAHGHTHAAPHRG